MKMVEIPFGPLHRAVMLERPNRFLLRCVLDGDGKHVEAHLADPGRLTELLFPGAPVWLRRSSNPRRKTQWSAVLTQDSRSGCLVSVQSALENALVQEAFAQGALEEFTKWSLRGSEYAYASSRWDFLLERPQGRRMLLEVKSVTLVQGGVALFPDAVTARGRRHLLELAAIQQAGEFETAVLFVVQRSDALRVAPAVHIDPGFAEAMEAAQAQGVRFYARACQVHVGGIILGPSLPVS